MFLFFMKTFMSDYFDMLEMLNNLDPDKENTKEKKDEKQKKIDYSIGLNL